MESRNLYQDPHRRFNPLTRDWVLVSPHRAERPWQGHVESATSAPALRYDPTCYLCPGNERAGGARNPKYETTFVFTNDFAALKPPAQAAQVQSAKQDESGRGLLLSESEAGLCKVMCFSPRHDLTLARMTVPEIASVVDMWAEQYAEIGALPYINYVQIFENRGEIMGAAIPIPTAKSGPTRRSPTNLAKSRNRRRHISRTSTPACCATT